MTECRDFAPYATRARAVAACKRLGGGKVHRCLDCSYWHRRAPSERDLSGCPCTLVAPCSYACTCASSVMSGGCARCCRYGSLEQRQAQAIRLAGLNNGTET